MPSASNTAYAAAKREPPYSDRTLVIDAGHGGADGGAVSAGGARESEINLDIALRLYMLAGFLGERAVLTRSSEDIAYSDEAVTVREKKRDDMKQRLAIIHSTENAVLVSIHQNKFDTPGPSGAQVIYAPDDESGALGETVQNALTEYLWRGNRQGAVRDNGAIYLLNNAACPAILIECGFLSNPAEEALLLTGRYRARVAAAIAGALRR
ncbi:MAG: N-acetylmuramoyl-L-alanine amidase [Oscillospiraceae bacterium]|jgi:N-acetylmuramoyl-L-alanine amidase|nr:N-acetylmuramoyl-L-alanine amidase [Oscillospiraceae bacterium]